MRARYGAVGNKKTGDRCTGDRFIGEKFTGDRAPQEKETLHDPSALPDRLRAASQSCRCCFKLDCIVAAPLRRICWAFKLLSHNAAYGTGGRSVHGYYGVAG